MRIKNSLLNMFFGITGQIVSALMGFIVRTVFVYTLGIEYLGINGLFTSILIMLSLANLGFDTTMIYSLYKPLAENNIYKIQALLNLYKKAYKIIGFVVLVIGLALLPVLPYIINGTTNIDNIEVIYLLFLSNSVLSYYLVYKQSIIIADQQQHIISKIHIFIVFFSNLLQIFVLFYLGSYITTLVIQIFCRAIENLYISHKANKIYPFLRGENQSNLSREERKEFFENLYSQMLYKFSGVVINGTDSIIISVLISVASVGIYSNYLLIISTITSFVSYLFYSITASVGNLIVKGNTEKKYLIFRVQNFSNFWIYGICAISLWNLINPFITLWLGNQYVFDKFIVFAIILNFFTAGMQNASTTFRETSGLFKKGKYRPVYAALINIIASILLAKVIGIAGVFLGTVISRISTYFWYDPYVIFKHVFDKPVKQYFLKYIWFVFLIVGSAGIIQLLGTFLKTGRIMELITMALMCVLIPNSIFVLLFKGTEEFEYLWSIFKSFIKIRRSSINTENAVNNP
jgi:O-antigen/teichoic acid export membrane protein